MDRKNFLELLMVHSTGAASVSGFTKSISAKENPGQKGGDHHLEADLVIAGGGMGGCAAALAALRNGLSVIMTEETEWIGGQFTQQGVPPDEHQWIETHGGTQLYRNLRTEIRAYYKRYYPLTKEAAEKQYLNPGDGAVSRICHEPLPALAALYNLFAPYLSSGRFTLLTRTNIVEADVDGDHVHALRAKKRRSGNTLFLESPFFIDATELGDLLPLTGTEYTTGAESKEDTGELHAADVADPENQQAFTYCFAMDYMPDADLRIDKPEDYDFWKNYVPDVQPKWPGRLLELNYANPSTLKPKKLGFDPRGKPTGDTLNLWNYRRIINPKNFNDGSYAGGITLVNWPQNDYMLGNLIDVSESEFEEHIRQSKQLSLSLFYWLQTEVPRPDGGQGWPGLRLRGDLMGTEDGLAKYPYVRESRRINAQFTILEEHVGREQRALVTGKKASEVSAASFKDSLGIGYYHIDLHPSTRGDNYIDFDSLPFQIPLGALLPKRMNNLLPACKNIGTTHITNGCYRLHPVEWNIGESVGMLASFALKKKINPKAVRENAEYLEEFQQWIRSQGIETHWPG